MPTKQEEPDSHKHTIYTDIPFAEYIKLPGMNQSIIKTGKVSMAHLQAKIEAPDKPPTAAMQLGTALHCMYLQPELAAQTISVWEQPKRGGEWKTFKSMHDLILSAKEYDNVIGMTKSLINNKSASKIKCKATHIELSARGVVSGVACKARVDMLTPDSVVDLKKIASVTIKRIAANPEVLRWHIRDFGYDLQAAMYCELFSRNNFSFIFVEDSAPYTVAMVQLDGDYINRAKEELYNLLDEYKRCKKYNVWPDMFLNQIITIGENDIAITAANKMEDENNG